MKGNKVTRGNISSKIEMDIFSIKATKRMRQKSQQPYSYSPLCCYCFPSSTGKGMLRRNGTDINSKKQKETRPYRAPCDTVQGLTMKSKVEN